MDFFHKICNMTWQNNSRLLLSEQQLELNKINEWNGASGEIETNTETDSDRVMEQAINNGTVILMSLKATIGWRFQIYWKY